MNRLNTLLNRQWRFVLTLDVVVRLIADATLLVISILIAMVGRLFHLIVFEGLPAGIDYRHMLAIYLGTFVKTGLPFIPFALVLFALNGFYSRGRSYYLPYKLWIVVRGVTLAFLGYGFLLYFLLVYTAPESTLVPRGVWVIAWLISLFMLTMARVWSVTWKFVSKPDYESVWPPTRSADKVLVIGGAGYIGSALLPQLLGAGYKVRVLDLLLFGTDPIAKVMNHPNLEIVQGDFRQVDKVVESMRDIRAVVHLGAIVGDSACALDERLTVDVNLTATQMIAQVAKAQRVERFVFASTCSVYGASDELLDEHSALNPVSLYARSKIVSERVLLEMCDDKFMPVILRFATIYGLSGRTRFDLVVNLLAAKAVVDRQITIFGGQQWRPFVHVEDAATAILQALEAPRDLVGREIFNVGSDAQNYTILQVGKLVQQIVPEAQLIERDSDTDRRNYRVSFTKIRNRLNFEPVWTIEQGILQVVEAIRTNKVGDYRDPRYSNVRFMSEEGGINILYARHRLDWTDMLLSQNSSGAMYP